MSGGPDPLYVRARIALLDAADALSEQLDAVVLVGAQAVYLHTGDADFATAEYTTDADFCVAPALHGMPLPTETTGRARDPSQTASRVTLGVTHLGETECMDRPFSGARLRHQRRAPAPESGPRRTLRHGDDGLRERRGARRTSERRILCQHQVRSLSPVRVHDQVGIARVNVAAARRTLQNEADG